MLFQQNLWIKQQSGSKILPYKFYTFDVLNVHICVLKSSVAFSQLNDSEFYSVTQAYKHGTEKSC